MPGCLPTLFDFNSDELFMFGNYQSLSHYLLQVMQILNCSDKVVVCAFIYIDRYFHYQNKKSVPGGGAERGYALNQKNSFFMLATCIVMAVKFYEEYVHFNSANKANA